MTIFCSKEKKKLLRILGVCLSVTIVFLYFCEGSLEQYNGKQSLSMYSGSYALMDGDTGRILKGKEESSPMANASTTKILTCIVTLEHCSLEEMVTVSSYAASQPRVKMGITEGKEYLLKDMIYGLMLESYNDCAVAIAEHVAGSTEAFAKLLNEKAVELGCKDTYFITPNGLDAEDANGFHHTTAEDLCRIMAYCTWESPKKELFLQITQTRNYDSFINKNSFLNQMDGVLTGKTGFTNKAGYCYVAAMEINGERYCIALLACGWPNNKTYKWKDARTLFEYGMETYDIKPVSFGGVEKELLVDGFAGEQMFAKLNKADVLTLFAEEQVYHLLMAEGEEIEKEIILYTDTKLPIVEGQKMGECNLYLENVQIASIPLVAKANANIWGWKATICTIFYQFLTFSL